MLINKFKLKYGDKPQISKFIDNEVAKYLKNDRLTEDTLRNLDSKIHKESQLRDKKEQIVEDRKSNASHKGARPASAVVNAGARPVAPDAISVASSRVSQRSQNRAAAQNQQINDNISIASSRVAPQTEVYSEIAEDDEWTAIQKFNQLLHYEE